MGNSYTNSIPTKDVFEFSGFLPSRTRMKETRLKKYFMVLKIFGPLYNIFFGSLPDAPGI